MSFANYSPRVPRDIQIENIAFLPDGAVSITYTDLNQLNMARRTGVSKVVQLSFGAEVLGERYDTLIDMVEACVWDAEAHMAGVPTEIQSRKDVVDEG